MQNDLTNNSPKLLSTLTDQVADGIVKRGLAVPAIFLLEMNKPLAGLFREGASIAAPLLSPLFLSIVGSKFLKEATSILGTKDGIESLIKEIEAREAIDGH